MTDFAPITYELWEAFAAERKCWEILDAPTHHLATDRRRYTQGEAFVNPMETETFVAEACPTREAAAYFIGLHSIQTALTAVGIIHANT